MLQQNYIQPDWPAPNHVRAFTSCRSGGFSSPPFDWLNIAQQKLFALGISQVFGGEYCTYQQENLFFSHRRATHQAFFEHIKYYCDNR